MHLDALGVKLTPLAFIAKAAVLALKKSGITQPSDLNGKKLGAPVFDAGRKAWPIFAKANKISNVTWTAMDPPLRETMLVRGDIDGFFGLALDNLVQFLLIDTLCRFVLGLPADLLYGRILPGAAVSLLVAVRALSGV